MKNNKDLAKIALAALILASTLPTQGQADSQIEEQGIFLAGGCAAHGCPSTSPSVKNSNANRANDTYETRGSTYQTDNQPYGNYSSGREAEAQLLDSLNPQGRAIYQSLDSEGKALALQLARQNYQDPDKNLAAVKEAQRRMNERRSLRNR
jgi:hypothetical protein